MTYIVQPGDTLSGISLKFLGTASATPTLFQINKNAIKSGSPTKLTAGEKLIIPDQMIKATEVSRKKPRDVNDVALVVNGVEYVGWESVKITRSLETAAAAFDVAVFDKWAKGEERWPIFDQDEVKVFIGSDLLIDGYVDKITLSVAAASHGMSVSGRDRTADLVDCSAMNRPGAFVGKKLEEIASTLAKPFGITVVTDQDTGPAIAKFQLLPGESVHASIARAAIAKNLIVTSAFSGRLAITRSGAKRTTDAIIEGQNMETGESEASSVERFSDYFVEGQSSGQGTAKNQQKGTYHDPSMTRYRPLMIHADQKATGEYVNLRAQWEARARAAKSKSGNVVVFGWRQSDGSLWQTNRIVPTHAPTLGLDDDLLISEVSFARDLSGGTTTGIKLVRPDAYTSEEELKATKDIIKVNRLNRVRKGRKGRGEKDGASKAEIAAEERSLKGIINDF